jgi:osmotically-inducible protein OsmY
MSGAGLKATITEHLSWDQRVDARGIEVEVRPGGEVVLRGTVESRQQARAAWMDALAVPGVSWVRTELSVRRGGR